MQWSLVYYMAIDAMAYSEVHGIGKRGGSPGKERIKFRIQHLCFDPTKYRIYILTIIHPPG